MAAIRTFVRPATQIWQSDVYADDLTIANAESSALSLEDDLNYIRSKIREMAGNDNWHDATLDSFSLKAIHDKRFTYWVQKADDVAVPTGQNFVVLSGATKPSKVIAFGATAIGAISAQIPDADVGAHSLVAAASNYNLCEVRDAATNDEILTATGGHRIYALLQVGQLAVDGDAFADAAGSPEDDRGQLSFVYINPATEALTAAPVSDIEEKTIEFAFRARADFYSLPEAAFDPQIIFTEVFGSNQIDLQVVYNNDTDGEFTLTTGKNYSINMDGSLS